MSTVLLVDDDAIVRKIIGAFLEDRGHTVLAAINGSTARQLAACLEIHILILDMQLPDVLGDKLAAELSRMRPRMKVALISASESAPANLPDGWMFLRKPFEPASLLEIIEQFSLR